jgi:hypothetical protein
MLSSAAMFYALSFFAWTLALCAAICASKSAMRMRSGVSFASPFCRADAHNALRSD